MGLAGQFQNVQRPITKNYADDDSSFQAPLLVQAVLNPIIGRLSDVIDRKMLVAVSPLIAFAGSVMSAKASDMNMLIAGGVLYGVTLATIGVVGTIPAEILPLKYRTVASGITFLGGASGGLYVVPVLEIILVISY
jgi:MFS family permease